MERERETEKQLCVTATRRRPASRRRSRTEKESESGERDQTTVCGQQPAQEPPRKRKAEKMALRCVKAE